MLLLLLADWYSLILSLVILIVFVGVLLIWALRMRNDADEDAKEE